MHLVGFALLESDLAAGCMSSAVGIAVDVLIVAAGFELLAAEDCYGVVDPPLYLFYA